jgi:hypothetical protein
MRVSRTGNWRNKKPGSPGFLLHHYLWGTSVDGQRYSTRKNATRFFFSSSAGKAI